jgi:hypothetical protein
VSRINSGKHGYSKKEDYFLVQQFDQRDVYDGATSYDVYDGVTCIEYIINHQVHI